MDGTLIEAWASLKSFQRKEQKDHRQTIRQSDGELPRGEADQPDA